jgi:uncharacterized protein YndB with AHSA1/START domain
VSATRISRRVNAPRAAVYRALLDAHAVATWMVPTGMTSRVHAFDPREGGFFRISLTYDEPTATGKTTAHTDTYHGRFVKLVANVQVVQVVEFETADPAMRGEMTITISLTDADSGTEIVAVHDDLPAYRPQTTRRAGAPRWRSSRRSSNAARARSSSASECYRFDADASKAAARSSRCVGASSVAGSPATRV